MSLFRYPQTYYSNTGGYVRGEWVTGYSGPLSFSGTIQPDTGKDLFPKETGQDDVGRVKVVSTTKLKASEETMGVGDLVVYGGRHYELVKELPYLNRIIPHYSYVGELREGVTP